MKNKYYLMLFVILFSAGSINNAFAVIPPPIPMDFCVHQPYIPEAQCHALWDFYQSTNGSEWIRSDGWVTFTDPCTWYGVTCDNDHVIYLRLHINNLNGPIPASIGDLATLRKLSLYRNQLNGSIPLEIGYMPNLDELNLGENLLSGAIPTTIGYLSNLQYLFLFDNQLRGAIPAGIMNLVRLDTLVLSRNQLSGPIPPNIGNLTNLTRLLLANNKLSGTIPVNIGNLTDLTELSLYWNQLSGSIPPGIGTLTKLTGLYLSDNQLCGEIPTEFGNLDYLKDNIGLSIDNNYLYTNDIYIDAFLVKKGGNWKESQRLCPSIWMPLFKIILEDKK